MQSVLEFIPKVLGVPGFVHRGLYLFETGNYNFVICNYCIILSSFFKISLLIGIWGLNQEKQP